GRRRVRYRDVSLVSRRTGPVVRAGLARAPLFAAEGCLADRSRHDTVRDGFRRGRTGAVLQPGPERVSEPAQLVDGGPLLRRVRAAAASRLRRCDRQTRLVESSRVLAAAGLYQSQSLIAMRFPVAHGRFDGVMDRFLE